MRLSDAVIAYIDIETTGLSPELDKIVSVAIILRRLRDKKQSIYYTLVDPECHIPNNVSRIHNIYDHDVANASKFCDVADEIARRLRKADLFCAYNSNFDKPFLFHKLQQEGHGDLMNIRNEWLDPSVIFLAPEFQPYFTDESKTIKNHKLTTIYEWVFNKKFNAHNAKDDTLALIEVYEYMINVGMLPDDRGRMMMMQSGYYR